jgi:hypothetical protein
VSALSAEKLHESLRLLGELMAVRTRPAQHLVVCGGASLIALDLVRRSTTRDVDILARIAPTGGLLNPRPLPKWLLLDAAEVGERLGLPKDWLNDQVAEETLFQVGLPPELQTRLVSKSYGPVLEVSFIGRRDQIFLKLHAAVDRDGGRHLQDLIELTPTREELRDAAHWTRTQDPSPGFLFNLRRLLNDLGHAELVEEL